MPQKAFTLVELLVSIAVIGILAGIVVTAVNPGETFIVANDAGRDVAVNTIQKAVYQYIIDTEIVPEDLSGTPRPICNPRYIGADNCVDLSVLVEEGYLESLPIDAAVMSGGVEPETTGFDIAIDSQGMIVASTPYYGEESGSVPPPVPYVYWYDISERSIYRKPLSGAGVPQLLATNAHNGLRNAFGFDKVNGHVIWSSGSSIWRNNFDGTNPVKLNASNFGPLLRFDPLSQFIYYRVSDFGLNRSPYPAYTPSQTVFFSFDDTMNYPAIDFTNGHVYYWGGTVSTPAVGRVNVDGTNAVTLVNGQTPVGLAYDDTSSQLYYIDVQQNKLMRLDTLDSVPIAVVHASPSGGLDIGAPSGIQFDHAGGYMYWLTDSGIARATIGSPSQIQLVYIYPAGTAPFSGMPHTAQFNLDLVNRRIIWPQRAASVRNYMVADLADLDDALLSPEEVSVFLPDTSTIGVYIP